MAGVAGREGDFRITGEEGRKGTWGGRGERGEQRGVKWCKAKGTEGVRVKREGSGRRGLKRERRGSGTVGRRMV